MNPVPRLFAEDDVGHLLCSRCGNIEIAAPDTAEKVERGQFPYCCATVMLFFPAGCNPPRDPQI